MDAVNLRTSVNNLPYLDRHQQDIHNQPMINQQQNAAMAENAVLNHLQRPNAAEGLTGKRTEPDDRRKEDEKRKKRDKKNNSSLKSFPEGRDSGGHFVDFSA